MLAALADYAKLAFQSTQPKRAATSKTKYGCTLRLFQSTQPKRAATKAMDTAVCGDGHFNPRSPRGLRQISLNIFIGIKNFNPRSPRGLRLFSAMVLICLIDISIHAAQEGCDSIRINCNYYLFYSYKSAKLTFLLN